jgi:hypothetical protein
VLYTFCSILDANITLTKLSDQQKERKRNKPVSMEQTWFQKVPVPAKKKDMTIKKCECCPQTKHSLHPFCCIMCSLFQSTEKLVCNNNKIMNNHKYDSNSSTLQTSLTFTLIWKEALSNILIYAFIQFGCIKKTKWNYLTFKWFRSPDSTINWFVKKIFRITTMQIKAKQWPAKVANRTWSNVKESRLR